MFEKLQQFLLCAMAFCCWVVSCLKLEPKLPKNWHSHIDASLSRQPLVKGERLVRYEVNAVIAHMWHQYLWALCYIKKWTLKHHSRSHSVHKLLSWYCDYPCLVSTVLLQDHFNTVIVALTICKAVHFSDCDDGFDIASIADHAGCVPVRWPFSCSCAEQSAHWTLAG